MIFSKPAFRLILYPLAAGVIGGATVQALANVGSFGMGWFSAGLFIAASVLLMMLAWRWAGGGKALVWMVTLAFVLRLAIGIGFSLALPVMGYDVPESKAGYMFTDAYKRDNQSWQLASSKENLFAAFTSYNDTDQYGGMLLVSSSIYRAFSPDAHRPFLILILGALAAAIGIPFLFKAVQLRWNIKLALLAGWIYTLYPDNIFFGTSQLREPFLIGLSAIAFWALLNWGKNRKTAIVAGILSLAAMTFLSFRVAIPVIGLLAVCFWFEYLSEKVTKTQRVIGSILIVLAGLALAVYTWDWLKSAAAWDSLVTERGSGLVTALLQDIGRKWLIPFVTIYGLAQTVLPAAIAQPSIPLLKTIAIIRALGWYMLAPMLVYAWAAVWKVKPTKDRNLLLVINIFIGFWLVISSARAGGDMWDNPRYRTIFIIWMAVIAAWGWINAREKHDPWLGRILAMEGICLAFFIEFYVSRYTGWFRNLNFFFMVKLILVLCAAVLIGSFAWDWYQRKKQNNSK